MSCRACAVLGQGLPYFFPDDRRFQSSFLCVFRGEHMWEFVSQTLVSSGPTNISRVDSRHSACTLNRINVEFIHTRFHFANYKPRRSYSHAVTNFQLRNGIHRFKEKFLTDDIFPSRHEILDSLHRELIPNQPFASSHVLITWIACSVLRVNNIKYL